MSLLDGLKTAIVNVLDPSRHSEKGELEYLRSVYHAPNGNIRRNQWCRLLSEAGNLVGFEWSCGCGMSFQLLSVDDWMGKTHNCTGCKTMVRSVEILRHHARDPTR